MVGQNTNQKGYGRQGLVPEVSVRDGAKYPFQGSLLAATNETFLTGQVKYKEKYEQTKGKMIGVKTVTDDSQMAHSALATRLQSDHHYRKEYEDTKTKHSASLDMLTLTHAKKAQDLATETNYRTFLHKYTTLPGDMKVARAKKAYGLLSDVSFTCRNYISQHSQSRKSKAAFTANRSNSKYKSRLGKNTHASFQVVNTSWKLWSLTFPKC